MKVGILAGGLGTRLSEETALKPKPMVEIGGQPILWHIMQIYAAQGFNEFVVALGYKGFHIKDYFLDYRRQACPLTVKLASGEVTFHSTPAEDWTVHLLDTGADTQTGGRLQRIADFVGKETFMLTYGDGVSNVDLQKLLAFHRRHGRIATVTAVRVPARFGGLHIEGDVVTDFIEKPQIGEGWISGGFFVLEPEVLNYLQGDQVPFELGPLSQLACDKQLIAYQHTGFWQCMDTLRDVRLLEDLWQSGHAPWMVWHP
jgi:glucose-1-phosphate cytidylyltransferase